MTTAIALSAALLCLAVHGSSGESPPVLSCNLQEIPLSARHRYLSLFRCLRAAVRRREEMEDGYSFHLEGQSISLQEVTEWISFERLCCPFLNLQLTASRTESIWLLTITGPKGVKPLLKLEFAPH